MAERRGTRVKHMVRRLREASHRVQSLGQRVLSWLGNDQVLVLVSVVGGLVGLVLDSAKVADEFVLGHTANDCVGLIVSRVRPGVHAHEVRRIDDVFAVPQHELFALLAFVDAADDLEQLGQDEEVILAEAVGPLDLGHPRVRPHRASQSLAQHQSRLAQPSVHRRIEPLDNLGRMPYHDLGNSPGRQ